MSRSLPITLLGLGLGLLTAWPAHGGRYRALEGRIYVTVADVDAVARAERGDLAVDVGHMLGMDIPRKVCEGTADKIRAALNDQADPEAYVPSTVTCEVVQFDTAWWWVYATAGGLTAEVVGAPPGTYLVAAVDVTDPLAVASEREGHKKVRLAKKLGVSVEGRVNEDVMYGILDRMNKQGVSAFVTIR